MDFFMGVPQQGSQQGGNPFVALLPIILIFVIFYIFFFLPVQRRQKAHQNMLNSLEKGDKVVTSGGIIGTIQSINREKGIVQLKIAENVKIEIQLPHITAKLKENE